MNDRNQQLLRKSLDGELSRLEREELDRLLLADPARRRELGAWARVEAALERAPAPAPPFALERIARAVGRGAAEGEAGARAAEPRRALPAIALATSAVILALLGAARILDGAGHPAPAPEPHVERAQAPVKVWLGAGEEEEPTPVAIRF